jgi:hypothetical protein
MINVLLVTSSQPEEVTATKQACRTIRDRIYPAQAGLVKFYLKEVTAPDRLLDQSSRVQYDIIHLTKSALAAVGRGSGEESPPSADASERILLSGSRGQAGGEGRPGIILDACPVQDAARILPGSCSYFIELPEEIDLDSRTSFSAAFYETVALRHSIQTAFWLGCCKTTTTQRPEADRLRIRSADGFEPRRKPDDIHGAGGSLDAAASCQHPVAQAPTAARRAPALTTNDFFAKYSGLCDDIKDAIAGPLIQRFDELLAQVYDDRGPVPVAQDEEFSNDFADLIVAIYRGPRVLELQRKLLEGYEDPSGRHENLFEWTLWTEVGQANLVEWLTGKTGVAYETTDAYYRDELRMGPRWQSQIVQDRGCDDLAQIFQERDLRFLNAAGYEFAQRMREAYRVLRGDTMSEMPVVRL